MFHIVHVFCTDITRKVEYFQVVVVTVFGVGWTLDLLLFYIYTLHCSFSKQI